jgi:O-glycosyl hydrolase
MSYNILSDAVPSVPAWSDTKAVEVGVKFITNGSMRVQGVRFYKGAGNMGTHTAHLWSSAGTLLATQNFTNETASGWQTVLFPSPVGISPGQIYTASYFAPQGRYAADVYGLINGKGLATDPVYAPSDSAAGGNGVYHYGENSGFPNDTYKAVNYYVDVIIASISGIPNLLVDVGSVQQTIDGMGVNINVNSWKNGELKPALDSLIDVNRSSAFRVIRDPMTWVSSELLIPALHRLDPPALYSVYEVPAMQDIWKTIGYLNQKGILGTQIILNFMGWTPPWLGGSGAYGSPSSITAGKEQAFATMVASLVYYGRVVKGLNFTYLSPLNEEDWNCKEGPCASPSQYALIMKDLATELEGMGVRDIRFIAPDTAGDPSAYIASISGDSTVFSITDHLTFHAYGGSRSPGTSYTQKNYWVTETGADCPSCDYSGSPSQGEWAFASQTNDAVLDDLANGIASVLIYDGYDSFYYHHNSYGFWGLLAYDQSRGVYSPRKRFYVNSQINRFVTPGSQTLSLTNSVSGLSHVAAFYNPKTQKISIVGHNTAVSPATINGQINNLPVAVSSMNVYETNASVDFRQGGAVPVDGGGFQLIVPPDTFFSLSN